MSIKRICKCCSKQFDFSSQSLFWQHVCDECHTAYNDGDDFRFIAIVQSNRQLKSDVKLQRRVAELKALVSNDSDVPF